MSLVDVPLFDLPIGALIETVVEPAPKLSADRARTLKAAATLAQGRHPLGGKLHADAAPADDRKADGLRCRGCVHVVRQEYVAGDYLKCDAHLITRGPGTDLRLWWPACEGFEAKDGAP